MVAWWWVLIAFAVGEWVGIIAIRFCNRKDKELESKYIK